MKKYKAILFDLDGVLVNMPQGHYEALNQALSLFGVSISYEEHITFLNGLPTRKKLQLLETQNRLPKGLIEIINNIKQTYTKERLMQYCVPEYEKMVLLSFLKKQGYILACCSNSVRETLLLMLKTAKLFEYFNLIVGNDDIVHPKPHSEIYTFAMQQLGCIPSECLIVEDSPHGIEAAKASGASLLEVKNYKEVNLTLFENIC